MTTSEKRTWVSIRPATAEEVKSLPFPHGVKYPTVSLDREGNITDIGEFSFMPVIEPPQGATPDEVPSRQRA